MKYVKVQDPEEVAAASLKTEAAQKEELAYSAEMSLEEAKASVLRGYGDENQLPQLRDNSLALRREANVYASAAQLTDAEIRSIRVAYLERWQEFTERNHIQHSSILKVKAELGEPTASYDSILEQLDIAHDLASKKLAEFNGKKEAAPTRRTTPKQKK